MRIGNGAFDQRQNDVYGAVLDSVYLHTKHGGRLPQRLWPVLEDQVRGAIAVWKKPDQGIWEARGEPQHYVSSKLMCWVALDRGARLAEIHGEPELAPSGRDRRRDQARHPQTRRARRRLPPALRDRRARRLDAADPARALPAARRRDASSTTVKAIARDLTDHGLVLRYQVEETDDGLHGEEGTFLICSFWLVSALEEIGEHRRAKALLEKLLAHASPLLLYAEELDVHSGRQLGNYPQAFTHLALINAVMHVIEGEESAR